MNFVEVSINICVSLLAAVIFGGLVAAVITSLFKPSSDVVPAIVIVSLRINKGCSNDDSN